MIFQKTTFILFFLCFLNGLAQEQGLMEQLQQEEHEAMEAIALYPEKEQKIILEATKHPEILVRVQNIRINSEINFKNLLAALPEEDQKKMYNLSRYPELIETLVEGGQKKEIDAVSMGFPEEVHEDAKLLSDQHFKVLQETHRLLQSSDEAFEKIISDYPQATQQTFKELIVLPEILSILTENMNMTVLLGDLYQKTPEKLKKELDSLNVILAEQKAKELNDWKQNLEEDPDAMADYEQASEEFARSQGYDTEKIEKPVEEKVIKEIYVQHVWRPYSFWFGWPSWYAYECWYPYPWWYHSGYYYNPHNVIVFIGLPSGLFVNWHFRHYRHFYHYPHFTNHLIRYYHHHRNSRTTITTAVRRWETENKADLPKNWLVDNNTRVERIKEYGKFKMDHQTTVEDYNNKVPTPRDYLKKNATRYPNLKPILKEEPNRTTPPAKEKVTIPSRQYDLKKYQPKEKVIEDKKIKSREIDRARDYHQNTWEKPKRQEALPPPRQQQTVPPKKEPQQNRAPQSPKQTVPDRRIKRNPN